MRPFKQLSALLFLMIALECVAGCSQAKYSAAKLPAALTAPRHISPRHLDLTKMRRNSIPAELLQPGDEVAVSIATGIETGTPPKWDLTIDSEGRLDVPLVGTTPIAGLSPTDASGRIRYDAIRRGLFIDPKVTVSLRKKRSIQVSVLGAVNKPSAYQLPATEGDLLTAITKAEGISDEATTLVEIRHSPTALNQVAQSPKTMGPGGVALASFQPNQIPEVITVDLAKLENYQQDDLRLLDGSVVNVIREPERKVSVIGLVNRADQIQMPPGEDLLLLDAIAAAGGTRLSIADKVHVIRRVPNTNNTVVIKASLADARSGGPSNMRLASGDIVSVEENAATVVVQTINTFFRVGFTAGFPGL